MKICFVCPDNYKSFQYREIEDNDESILIGINNSIRRIFKLFSLLGITTIAKFDPIFFFFFKRLLKTIQVNDGIDTYILYSRIYESMGDSIIRYIRKKGERKRIVIYWGDLVRCHTIDVNKVRGLVDLVATYDYGDAVRYGFRWCLEPYYTKIRELYPIVENPKYDVTFIGEAKDRYKTIIRIYEMMSTKGLKCDFHIDLVPPKYRKHKNEISYGRLKYSDYISHIRDTRCVLEIVQNGAMSTTMRYPETILMGKNLLSNSPYFEDENKRCESIFYFKTLEDLNEIDVAEICMPHMIDMDKYEAFFSCDRFFNELLSEDRVY